MKLMVRGKITVGLRAYPNIVSLPKTSGYNTLSNYAVIPC